MRFVYDDGGRAASGYTGQTGDCAARAIAIAAQQPYSLIYDRINKVAERERPGSKRARGRRSSARSGVFMKTMHRVMYELGFVWVATMQIGSGCKVHLRDGELPAGRIVVRLSKHFAAVIDGVLHDTYEDDRNGTRCVYGYWIDRNHHNSNWAAAKTT